jgi:hypothetical protein
MLVQRLSDFVSVDLLVICYLPAGHVRHRGEWHAPPSSSTSHLVLCANNKAQLEGQTFSESHVGNFVRTTNDLHSARDQGDVGP